ncbi:MAG: penicillin acylase family protein [Pseudomonadales bacterium]|nr:penicillin acylase family protein [Pseudomonadales bacterium]
MISPLRATCATALTAVAALCFCTTAFARASTGTLHYQAVGLEKPAEILVDNYGIPHIYAGTHYDAFFVQGFNAARDRLWQIDLWRRRGLGQLAEVLGEKYVAQDRAARLFLYRGDMYREWLAYGSDAKRIAQAFTAGINAYVDLLDAQPALLPPEFALLDYRPSRWAPEDVVRIRSHGLTRNVTTEVQRAKLVCAGGLELAARWKVLEPAWTTQVPAGLDPCDVPDDVLRDYFLATAPVLFDKPENAVASARDEALRADYGSNNWVVAPERSATGRPILANDPHRGHAVPSLRYVAHLVAPDLNVIGAGEPALPGISIGHNERIAFGLTIFPIDQEDLYVYERTTDGYRYAARSEPLTVVHERIPVRGGRPVEVELAFTRHGPIVFQDQQHLWAVRAAWLEPGMAPYFGSVEYMRAGNWRQFSAALNRWGAPSENQVYADVDGNIGYKAAGLTPVRRTWDGLLPVPGDGRYEWEGFADMDVIPGEFNPSRGFTGTANSMNLPESYDIASHRLGFEWSAPWRYRRIFDVLGKDERHTLAASTALQRDYHAALANAVLDGVSGLAERGEAGHMLAQWDRVVARESGPGALWAVWYYQHLSPAIAALTGGEHAKMLTPVDPFTVLEVLKNPADFPEADGLVTRTLAAAWEDCRQRLGNEPANWTWGSLHRTAFMHPLANTVDPVTMARLGMPDYGRGGTGNTVNNTHFTGSDFLVRSGASFRMVLDVGRWDDARMTNAPGQSGDPRSPFYANLLEGWANDGDFPLLFSRRAVEKNLAMRIQLEPVGTTQ